MVFSIVAQADCTEGIEAAIAEAFEKAEDRDARVISITQSECAGSEDFFHFTATLLCEFIER